MPEGKLVIISAPSGAGKTTIVRHLLNSNLNLGFSISATTRPRREGESEGRDYYFMSVNEFRERAGRGDFAEWEEVYAGHYYGTLKAEIERIRSLGSNALFDVDVRGGISLKTIYRDEALAIFIMPPSVKELERRLVSRGTDTPEKIKMRIRKAEEEIGFSAHFDRIVLNDDIDKACLETTAIIKRFISNQNP